MLMVFGILCVLFNVCLTSMTESPAEYVSFEQFQDSNLREKTENSQTGFHNFTFLRKNWPHLTIMLFRTSVTPLNGFVVKTRDRDGFEEVEIQTSSVRMYEGHVDGLPGSWVHLTQQGNITRGYFYDSSDIFTLQGTANAQEIGGQYAIARVKHKGPNIAGCDVSLLQSPEKKMRKPHHRGKRYDKDERKLIELFVVIDSTMFSDTGIRNNKTFAVSYVESVVQHLNRIFSDVGIQVVLIGVEMWSHDPVTLSTDATELLATFLEFSNQHITNNQKMDFVMLLSGLTFQNFIVGMAHVGVMCGRQSGAVVHYEPSDTLKTAVTSAHEMGHALGLLHDDASCRCSDNIKKCVMEPDISMLPTVFSSCSRDTLEEVLSDGGAPCLYDKPDVVYNGPICGNGIRERNEICDCGNKQECSKSECCSVGCRLKPGAECDKGGCCKECQIQAVCTLCRSAQNDCDLEEFCDGNSEECPANLYKKDLSSCGKSGAVGYCYHGKCRSNKAQCEYLWGKGAKPSDTFCSMTNKIGTVTGNCGTKKKHPTVEYKKCTEKDKMCGLISCDSPNQYPVIGGRQKISTIRLTSPDGSSVSCRAAAIDLGDDVPDPGLVDDGSPCYYGNTSGVCLDNQCKHLHDVSHKICPNGTNGLECSGNGICNNHGDCWCRYGYSGKDCSIEFNRCIRQSPNKVSNKFPVWAIVVTAVCGTTLTVSVILVVTKKKGIWCWKQSAILTKVEAIKIPVNRKGDGVTRLPSVHT